MEPNPEVIADKLWNIVQVLLFMIKKNVSKNKLVLNLHHLMMKRGKTAKKAIENIVLNNNSTFGCIPQDPHLAFISPKEYEFSCSNSPAFPFHASTKRRHRRHSNDVTAGVWKRLEKLNNEAREASPLVLYPKFGKSPLVRQLRITDSPFSVGEGEANSHVDEEAGEFIERFYAQLRHQKQIAAIEDWNYNLLEVVDRRAKSVASEQEIQARSIKQKEKAQLRLSTIDASETSDGAGEQFSTTASEGKVFPDTDIEEHVSVKASEEKLLPDADADTEGLSSENGGDVGSNEIQTSKELQMDLRHDGTTPEISLPDSLPNEVEENDGATKVETLPTVNDLEADSPIKGESITEKTIDEGKEPFALDLLDTGVDTIDRDLPADAGQDIKTENEGTSQKIDDEGSELGSVETHVHNHSQAKDADTKEEPLLDSKKQQEFKAETSAVKEQEQLDEAQGLLKSAISTGQSKEARLARVCAGLSSRLQEYKSENAQLEELLTAERERSNSYGSRVKQLQKDLSTSKVEVSRVESHMVEALAAKNSEIDSLVNLLDTLKKQASVSEGKLASSQVNMESIMRNRELTETRMLQALREELGSADRRAEEERAAHNATKMAAMEREVSLEHRAVETSTALARMQRAVDERTSKVAELEQKLAFLEAESASLNQELQDMEVRVRRGQKKPTEEANQALQMQAWQEEVDRARQGQRDAESKAQVQKMRVEMAGMKRDAEHYSRQEHMELEKRYRELTDLLYHKQTQLEAMASEKSAAEFQLEKEVKRLQEVQVEAERVRPPRRVSSSYWEEDADLKALEPLPLHHRHIAGASLQLQKAAKLLDSGAVTATRFLWRYPIARVILLCYMAQADSFSAQEVAASMGLTNPTLP
ncbi:hypothetical protein IFM89_022615 [Coptis chinensis]|uniref:Golgin candidate 1 n=1 Tax=Coptis chinensis TaxID=261450 RepID=A0A835IEW4_9MAGN|nr:hypothetical protein IFM89_022615 [Coptis chinensis]